jgi:chromate transporter
MIYLKLFWSFFQIGLFSFGGGYAAMPLIQNQVVDINNWLSMSEFADVITISQMTPGPIGINSATFVGIRVGGIGGAIVATIGCILPSCMIVLSLAYVYYKYRGLTAVQGVLNGLRPAVIAMIASAGLALIILAFWSGKGITSKRVDLDFVAVVIFTIAFIVLRKWKVNPIHVMIGSGIIGLCIYSLIL